MSGGYYNGKEKILQSDIFGWGTETTEQAIKLNPLKDKEISGIVFDLLNLLHEFDLAISGDTNMGNYYEEVTKFKDKWLNSEVKDRIRYVIDNSIKDLKEELYLSFGLPMKEE